METLQAVDPLLILIVGSLRVKSPSIEATCKSFLLKSTAKLRLHLYMC